jgi:hypothetical protein
VIAAWRSAPTPSLGHLTPVLIGDLHSDDPRTAGYQHQPVDALPGWVISGQF